MHNLGTKADFSGIPSCAGHDERQTGDAVMTLPGGVLNLLLVSDYRQFTTGGQADFSVREYRVSFIPLHHATSICNLLVKSLWNRPRLKLSPRIHAPLNIFRGRRKL